MGRPTLYTEELGTEICTHIANGLSIRKIEVLEGMPARETIRRWLVEEDKPEFQAQYTRAREDQADYYADVIVDIATECEADSQKIAKARLEIDTIKWVASKLKAKKYGDKLHMAGDDDNPVIIKDESRKGKMLAMLTEEQLREMARLDEES